MTDAASDRLIRQKYLEELENVLKRFQTNQKRNNLGLDLSIILCCANNQLPQFAGEKTQRK